MCYGVLVCVIVSTSSVGELPSVDEILAGSRRRAERLANANLEIEYTVRAKYWPGRAVAMRDKLTDILDLDAVDTLRVMAPERREDPRPWRCWTRRVRGRDGKLVLDYFTWCTGRECGFYQRQDDVQQQRLYSSVGRVRPAPGPAWFMDNVIDWFLWRDFQGSIFFFDLDWRKSEQGREMFQRQMLGREEVVGTSEYLGLEVYVVRSECTTSEGAKWRREHWVTGPPDYWVLRSEQRFEDCPEPFIEEVLSLETREGVVLPTAGRLVHPGYKRSTRWEYAFSVTSVKQLTERDRHPWQPAWPTGTSVSDQVRNKGFRVHYPPHEEERIRRAIVPRSLPTAIATTRSPVFVFNIAMFLLFVAALFVYRYKRRRAARMAGGSP